jgi:hypothetical protein
MIKELGSGRREDKGTSKRIWMVNEVERMSSLSSVIQQYRDNRIK